MAITIDWATKVINVPQADLEDLGGGVYKLDIDLFRIRLNELQSSEEGMPEPTTHEHNAPVTIAGVDLARVVRIINGYTVTFENGSYAVNLIGANSNIADVTNINNVSIRSANTAGLTYSKQVEDQTFTDSRVWIDVDNGTPGIIFPQGTPGQPVNNLADAQTIIANRTLPKRLHIRGNVIVSGQSLAEYNVTGTGRELSGVVLDGSSTVNFNATNMAVSGTADGLIECLDCHAIQVQDFVGTLTHCGLKGTTRLANIINSGYEIIDCYSHEVGATAAVIDVNDVVGPKLNIRNWTGGLTIQNFSDAGGVASIDCVSGRVTLDPTCTAGTIVIGGLTTLTDNSGPGCTVVRTNLDAKLTEQVTAYSSKITIDTANGVSGQIYPTGTPAQPVNNMADAKTLAQTYGLKTFSVVGTLVLGPTDDVSGFVFEGTNEIVDVVVLAGATTAGTKFTKMTVTGAIDGPVIFRQVGMQSVSGIGSDIGPSLFHECILLESTMTLKSGLVDPGNIQFVNCVSGVQSGSGIIFDFAGATTKLAFRNYSGAITIQNYSGGQLSSLDFAQGELTLENTCTSGTLHLNGLIELFDNSAGTTVDYFSVSDNVWDSAAAEHSESGSFGLHILESMYRGSIWIDPNNGVSGTAVGINGTVTNPVDNLADAESLATALNLQSYHLVTGSFTLTSSLTEWDVVGHAEVEIDLNGQNVNASRFQDVLLKGAMSGRINVDGGAIEDVTGLSGVFENTGILGDNVLATGSTTMHHCMSQVPGSGTPSIDFNGAGSKLNMRGYDGGMLLKGMSDASNIATMDMNSGHVNIESSCTAGELVVRGVGKLTDNSAGTTVDSSNYLQTSGGLNATESARLLDIYRILGLDPAEPLTVSAVSREAGGTTIQQTISVNAGIATVTRI